MPLFTDADLPDNRTAYWRGLRIVPTLVLTYVLFATYIGIGALAHDLGFSLLWAMLSTAIIWASPAQLVLMSTLGAGATLVQAALGVTLSGVRLFPMAVSLLPLMRGRSTRLRDLILPAHFTAVTFWIESLRLLPQMPQPRRIAFANGLGTGLVISTTLATAVGYLMAANLPAALAAGVLFLAPISFLLTLASNSRRLAEWMAIGLGLAIAPLVSALHTGIDLVIGGVVAGSLAYIVDRVRRGR